MTPSLLALTIERDSVRYVKAESFLQRIRKAYRMNQITSNDLLILRHMALNGKIAKATEIFYEKIGEKHE